MEALEILLDGIDVPQSRRDETRDFLGQVLQSKTTYEAYFSSLPLPGSIVEDIAEVDARIVELEHELKRVLIDNKTSICESLVREPVEPQLSAMLSEIGKLWELEKNESSESAEAEPKELLLLGIEEPAVQPQDAFHTALQKLKERKGLEDGNTGDNLALVLANLTSINELLELPALTSICIKTGHYQEALLCHSHARTLTAKYPNVQTVRHISETISEEITTTMLQGLVKMLKHNLSTNPMKKILTYLSSIPPFSSNPQALIQVFLSMRYNFVNTEMASFQITELTNDTMRELLIKRKIEAFREHVYSALAILPSTFDVPTQKIAIPLLGAPKKPLSTNPLTLLFIKNCCDLLIQELTPYRSLLSESVCLQLVYCSFRLADCSQNYHHLFMNKIQEAELFSTPQLSAAMGKRRELASKYY